MFKSKITALYRDAFTTVLNIDRVSFDFSAMLDNLKALTDKNTLKAYRVATRLHAKIIATAHLENAMYNFLDDAAINKAVATFKRYPEYRFLLIESIQRYLCVLAGDFPEHHPDVLAGGELEYTNKAVQMCRFLMSV